MSERTKWDDTVDEAIERLIAGDTEGFVLTTIEERDVHLVKATDSIDDDLLSIFLMVEHLCRMTEEAGDPMSPEEVLAAAAHVAGERGYLDGEVEMYERE